MKRLKNASFLFSYFFLFLLFVSHSAGATSFFHSYITDLSPPYICKLKLKSARGVSLDTKRSYQFNGICSIKIPIGTTWTYQHVWVDLQADWNADTNEGLEVAILRNGLGSVITQVKCDDDPWLTKAQCALVGYRNNTHFTNLGGVFNNRNGQYPPFEIITGQYPPLARNQAILQEAIALSLLTATQEVKAAESTFAKTFPAQTTINTSLSVKPNKVTGINASKRATKTFKYPRIDNFRVDCCLQLNKECGKPAADRFCQRMGYKKSIDCKVDTTRAGPTFILGTQTICSQPYCKGFKEVICSN
jgi:hypothetical protein